MTRLLSFLKSPKLVTGCLVFLGIFSIIGNTGFWLMPNLSTQYWISQNLVQNTFTNSAPDYLYSSYLLPALFWVLGGRNLLLYIAFCFGIAITFLSWFSLWFIAHHGRQVAIEELKLLVALVFPVFFIPIYGIGMDSMTLLLMLSIAIYLSSRWVIIPSILLGIQHFEQGISAFVLLAVSIVLSFLLKNAHSNKKTILDLATVILGLVLGKALLSAWFWFCGLELQGDRLTYARDNWQSFVHTWSQYWWLIAWSLLGVGWLIVFKDIRRFLPLLIAAVLTIFLTLTVADQTRVGAIVLFPSVFYWVMRDKSFWQQFKVQFSTIVLIFYLIVPPVVVWGKPYGSLWKYDLQIMQEIIQTGGPIKGFDSGLPFKE